MRQAAGARPTFLLGVGCQKGGTSWLYNYLAHSPEFARGFRKEYHVFSSLDVASQAGMRAGIVRDAEAALAGGLRDPKDARALQRAAMLADPDVYVDYFVGLLEQPTARVCGDITPTYALLSPERLRDIRERFAARGIRTAVVFMMRDPVERTYSQLRMQHGRAPDSFAQSPEEMLLSRHGEITFSERNDYGRTIAAVDAAFDAADVGYGFFETLFTADQVRRFTDLLGMDFRPPRLDRARNASSTPRSAIPDETARVVAEHYAHVYRAVAERFPEVDLKSLWPHSRHVLG